MGCVLESGTELSRAAAYELTFHLPSRFQTTSAKAVLGSDRELKRPIVEFPILGNLSSIHYTSGVNPRDHAYHRAYKEFISRLVLARKQAGLTQVEVAKRMGKAHSFVSKCELGERRVDFVELQLFARIYEKDLAFFSMTNPKR